MSVCLRRRWGLSTLRRRAVRRSLIERGFGVARRGELLKIMKVGGHEPPLSTIHQNFREPWSFIPEQTKCRGFWGRPLPKRHKHHPNRCLVSCGSSLGSQAFYGLIPFFFNYGSLKKTAPFHFVVERFGCPLRTTSQTCPNHLITTIYTNPHEPQSNPG